MREIDLDSPIWFLGTVVSLNPSHGILNSLLLECGFWHFEKFFLLVVSEQGVPVAPPDFKLVGLEIAWK